MLKSVTANCYVRNECLDFVTTCWCSVLFSSEKQDTGEIREEEEEELSAQVRVGRQMYFADLNAALRAYGEDVRDVTESCKDDPELPENKGCSGCLSTRK